VLVHVWCPMLGDWRGEINGWIEDHYGRAR
jgi:hypothetical protein